MKKSIRLIAATLAVAMMAPMICACGKNRGKEKVSADDPWYSLSKVSLNDSDSSNQYDYVYRTFIGMEGENFVFRKSGQLALPADFDYESNDYTPYQVEELNTYDPQGNLISTIDLTQLLSNFNRSLYPSIGGIQKNDSGFTVELRTYPEGGSVQYYSATVNATTGELGEPQERSTNETIDRLTNDEGGSDEGTVVIGSYSVTKIWFSASQDNANASYDIVVTDQNGTSTEFDMRTLYPNLEVFNVNCVVDIGDNKVLLGTNTGDGVKMYFVIDLNTMSMSQDNSDMSWIEDKVYMVTQVEGLGSVVRNPDGLYSINYANRSLDPVFLYTSSNINAYEISNLTPIYVTSDRAVFTGPQYEAYPTFGFTATTIIYTFERQDTNPNAGKVILDLASVTDLSYPLCEAVCSFNETNPDYFIRYDMQYQFRENYSEDAGQTNDENSTSLGNQLAVDIMSGTGPDLIVNGSRFGMLNNTDYLLDLGPFITENCSSDAYFTNIFDAADNEGKLYQVPLSISVDGIITDAGNVEAGIEGFTFDQYDEFVNGPCNGVPPISGGQMDFFINALNGMTDLMIDADGTVDYDNDAFRALAEYTAQHVNESLQTDDEEYYYTQSEGYTTTIRDVTSYFESIKNGSCVFLGMPSYDGRGPAMTPTATIAISAQTIAPDACKDFVLSLLGNDTQELFGSREGLPVNRAAFDSIGSRYVTYQNDMIDYRTSRMTEAELILQGINTTPMSESAVDDFAALVSSLTSWYTNDGSINAIIREEMPAYFEGQKTLEQIIPVLEDRVHTVLSERR